MIGVLRVTTLGGAVALSAAVLLAQADGPAATEPVRSAAAIPADARRSRTAETLSPELIEACLEVAAEVDPHLAARLRDIRRKSPGPAFERAIRNARHLVGLARLRERDPQLYEIKVALLQLDAQIDVVAAQLRETRRLSSGAAGELEDQLRVLVRKQVGLSIASRGMYLRRLRENMKSLQDQLAQDSANFNKTVEDRLVELIEPVETGSPVPAAPSANQK